jgi:hypothetical protein
MTDTNWYEQIYVGDDLVDEELIKKLAQMIIAPGWRFGAIGNPKYNELSYNIDEKYEEKIYGLKHLDQYWELSFNANELYSWENNDFGMYDLWKIIRKYINNNFKNLTLDLVRCRATGSTNGTFGLPTTENSDNNIYIILYYVNPLWRIEWDGQTVFYNESNITKSIYPKPGRIVFFPSKIPYTNIQPNKFFPGLKTTVIFECFDSNMIPT